MIIAATGHRPDKLGGHSYKTDVRLMDLALVYLEETKPARVITGMALGWDTAWAMAAFCLGIPFTAAVPFEGQERRWPADLQKRYLEIRGNADEVVVISRNGFSAYAMDKRNRWMVDNSDRVCSLWDGSPGGTGNCVRYAQKRKAPIDNLWTRWELGIYDLNLLI